MILGWLCDALKVSASGYDLAVVPDLFSRKAVGCAITCIRS